jgi:hypothetical protein
MLQRAWRAYISRRVLPAVTRELFDGQKEVCLFSFLSFSLVSWCCALTLFSCSCPQGYVDDANFHALYSTDLLAAKRFGIANGERTLFAADTLKISRKGKPAM